MPTMPTIPTINSLVEVQNFDDGNSPYTAYTNVWCIKEFMFNRGKVKLQNNSNKEIVIRSISTWKVKLIDNSD